MAQSCSGPAHAPHAAHGPSSSATPRRPSALLIGPRRSPRSAEPFCGSHSQSFSSLTRVAARWVSPGVGRPVDGVGAIELGPGRTVHVFYQLVGSFRHPFSVNPTIACTYSLQRCSFFARERAFSSARARRHLRPSKRPLPSAQPVRCRRWTA